MSTATSSQQQSQIQPAHDASLPLSQRVYKNLGNSPLVELIDRNCRRVLDVGCGAGDNAALLRSRLPACEVLGITYSENEAARAREHLAECWVGDVETWAPESLIEESVDAILFSHILEHLRHPQQVVARYARFLRRGGQIVIGIPNVLQARQRLKFLRGDFEYSPEGGIMDDTHLHFYTYFTADRYLIPRSSSVKLTRKMVTGHVPLPMLRGRMIPTSLGRRIDSFGCRHWPNLFGGQIILTAEKL